MFNFNSWATSCFKDQKGHKVKRSEVSYQQLNYITGKCSIFFKRTGKNNYHITLENYDQQHNSPKTLWPMSILRFDGKIPHSLSIFPPPFRISWNCQATRNFSRKIATEKRLLMVSWKQRWYSGFSWNWSKITQKHQQQFFKNEFTRLLGDLGKIWVALPFHCSFGRIYISISYIHLWFLKLPGSNNGWWRLKRPGLPVLNASFWGLGANQLWFCMILVGIRFLGKTNIFQASIFSTGKTRILRWLEAFHQQGFWDLVNFPNCQSPSHLGWYADHLLWNDDQPQLPREAIVYKYIYIVYIYIWIYLPFSMEWF